MKAKLAVAIFLCGLCVSLIGFFAVSSTQGVTSVKILSVQMQYGSVYSPMNDDVYPILNVTLTNKGNSALTSVTAVINDSSYDGICFVPSHQTENVTVILTDFSIENGTTYRMRLVFSADGLQQYSTAYVTHRFNGEIQIVNATLELPNPNITVPSSGTLSSEEFLSAEGISQFILTFHNNGNLPVTGVNITVENVNCPLFGNELPVWPNNVASAYSSLLWLDSSVFKVGGVYPVTVHVTYADGSTSIMQSSVVATYE